MTSKPYVLQEMDMLVSFIQLRRSCLPTSRFDFIPCGFIYELRRLYQSFVNASDREGFIFPADCWSYLVGRPLWFQAIDVVYIPFQIRGDLWVGLLVDLVGWTVTVLDTSGHALSLDAVTDELLPFATILPYFIRRSSMFMQDINKPLHAFIIGKMDISFPVVHSGLSGVATVILMELSALNRVTDSGALTEDVLRRAAENYAMECFKNLGAKKMRD